MPFSFTHCECDIAKLNVMGSPVPHVLLVQFWSSALVGSAPGLEMVKSWDSPPTFPRRLRWSDYISEIQEVVTHTYTHINIYVPNHNMNKEGIT